MTDIDSERDAKEQHRLGTINRWDPPDDAWAEEYDWTRYRGPPAFPVPGGWILNIVEGDGTGWYYYGEYGVGESNDTDIDRGAVEDPVPAWLTNRPEDPENTSRGSEPDREWDLTIDGETIFRRVNPNREDLYGTTAAALQAYHEGTLEDQIDDFTPSSGRLPADLQKERELNRRKEQNQSLGEFTNSSP